MSQSVEINGIPYSIVSISIDGDSRLFFVRPEHFSRVEDLLHANRQKRSRTV